MIRAAVLAVLLAGAASQSVAACRQALALGLDVSGSVDAREYRQQLEGLAEALNTAEVRGKLLEMPAAPVRLLIYEWSGPADQMLLLPWTEVRDTATLDQIIETLRQTRRRAATPGTALGVAMSQGRGFLDQQPDCWKRTLDISGDGKSNLGPRPRDIKHAIRASGITINGLAIGADAPQSGDLRQSEISELSAYYKAEVILGPDAFVQTALGFDSYSDAMKRKLLRELDGLILSYLQTPRP
ncbi:MAG: hypothetical protein ACJAVM_001500 [Sulfitobacter sp.]|jgi:hypothetical protein